MKREELEERREKTVSILKQLRLEKGRFHKLQKRNCVHMEQLQAEIAHLDEAIKEIDRTCTEDDLPSPTPKEEKKEDAFGDLLLILQKGKEVIESKKSLLTYFFGRHPKAYLAHLLHEGEKKARKALTHCDGNPHLEEFLHRFIAEVNRPWNSALYNHKFLELYHHYSTLIAKR